MNERKWLKEIRVESNFTQEEMADKLHIPRTTYAMYEQGERTPSVRNAQHIGKKLDIDWTIFFWRTTSRYVYKVVFN